MVDLPSTTICRTVMLLLFVGGTDLFLPSAIKGSGTFVANKTGAIFSEITDHIYVNRGS